MENYDYDYDDRNDQDGCLDSDDYCDYVESEAMLQINGDNE